MGAYGSERQERTVREGRPPCSALLKDCAAVDGDRIVAFPISGAPLLRCGRGLPPVGRETARWSPSLAPAGLPSSRSRGSWLLRWFAPCPLLQCHGRFPPWRRALGLD